MKHARAILWAQWRTQRNSYLRGGAAWTTVIGVIWYGMWAVAAIAVASVTSNPDNVNLLRASLPGGLVLVFLYWQVVPLLMAATGASLDLRKLQAYPIPLRQLPHLPPQHCTLPRRRTPPLHPPPRRQSSTPAPNRWTSTCPCCKGNPLPSLPTRLPLWGKVTS